MSDQDIIDTIAAHRIQTAWHGKHDGWWECTCQGGESSIPWTPEHVLAALRERYEIGPISDGEPTYDDRGKFHRMDETSLRRAPHSRRPG